MPSIINATTTNGVAISPDNSGSLQLATNNGTTAVTIDTSQNVGIGTTSPSSFYSEARNLVVGTGSGGQGMTIYAGTTSQSRLMFADGTSGSDAYTGYVQYDHSSNALQFGTNGGTERMRITSGGDVGIGLTSPAQKLDVSGSMRLTFAGGNNYVEFQSASNYVGRNGTTGDTWLNTAGGTNISFGIAGTERMRIDSSGRVLVNTTTNYGRTTLLGNNTDIPLACWNNAGTSGFFTMISFRNNAGTSEIGNVLRTNDNTISFNNTSDYRLKENIQPMVGALDKVARLKPCTYTWKSDGSAGQGFIAHELQEVVPDAVAGEKDAVNEDGSIRPQGIDTSFLVATLTAAIQELKAQLDESNLILTSVKTELDTVKAELNTLKNPPVEGTE